MIKKILTSCLLMAPLFAYANSAEVCNNCQTETKAAAYARAQANPLQCSPVFDQNFNCTSRSKIVTFVDWDTEKVYKYNVFTDQSPPFNARAEKRSLTTAEREGYPRLLRYEKDLREAIRGANATYNDFLGSQHFLQGNQSFQSFSNFSNLSSASSDTSNCPTDTALAAALDRSRFAMIRNFLIERIQNGELAPNNVSNLNPRTTTFGISAVIRGIPLTLSTNSGQNQRPAILLEFRNSEAPSNLVDFLALDVSVLGENSRGDTEYGFKINDNSRVAGFTLADLRGNQGRVRITNECIAERFAEATALGNFTRNVTPIGGGQSGSGGDGNVGGGGGVLLPSGSRTSCKISDFVQNGAVLYTFIDCS